METSGQTDSGTAAFGENNSENPEGPGWPPWEERSWATPHLLPAVHSMGLEAGQVPRQPSPDSAASDPGRACLPPPQLSSGLEPRGFFFFPLKQSYLFTLISCLKNVNKITQ